MAKDRGFGLMLIVCYINVQVIQSTTDLRLWLIMVTGVRVGIPGDPCIAQMKY